MEDLKDEELVDFQDARENWLRDFGAYLLKDVMEDEDGREYIMVNYEEEGGADNWKKVFLPDELQDIRKPF